MPSTFDVDGIPAVAAKRAGPLTAGLIFRVGRADETLATAGITHLVEHLALHRFGLGDYHFNGATAPDHTYFEMQGSESEVVSFLEAVCASLGNLPMDRLETEKSILRTEEAGRGGAGSLYRHRYGAQGYGLVDYLELGVPRLRPAEVAHWARTWFTRENAALWVAGETVPSGLRLSLPPGARHPIPARPAVLPRTPTYFAQGSGEVRFSAVVRQGAAAQIFAKVLERELFRALRQEGGYSYQATTSYQRRGEGFAEILGLADALPDKQDAVVGGIVDVLAKVKAGRIDPRDIEAVRGQAESALYGADADVALLPHHAARLLSGRPLRTPEERIAELRSVSAADVHAVAVEACGSVLLRVPAGRSADWAGYTEVPRYSAAVVEGTRFPASKEVNTHLIAGTDGCSVQTPDGASTVRFADCAAMLAWPDGGRRLIGTDGRTVAVEPTLFAGLAPEVVASIDAAVGPHRTLPQPARRPEEIPRPATAASTRPPAAAGRKGGSIAFTVVASIVGVFALLATAGMAMDPATDAAGWIGAGVIWLVAGLFAFLAVRRR
ncbi:insulinase family protein [Amycolatopsis balhimycina DSM 5908]|uniref:Insulinase family protein n=1 Tax=Amycolatopsis balhimycina DSM 5908 TaxID=1081091 RepID=A0A428X0I4_AMYBA|nr:insulinase family protein [Amycolatopsis balhimycina]RSM48862.1 insulinase family protein [Amycolatopsis balhimycina DSM 5908]